MWVTNRGQMTEASTLRTTTAQPTGSILLIQLKAVLRRAGPVQIQGHEVQDAVNTKYWYKTPKTEMWKSTIQCCSRGDALSLC